MECLGGVGETDIHANPSDIDLGLLKALKVGRSCIYIAYKTL